MSTSDITPDQILSAIEQVPPARWGEVLHVIEGLQSSNQSETAARPVRTGRDLEKSELIGIWADRAAVASAQEFAQELRREAEQRGR
jgi:hypothetical protein